MQDGGSIVVATGTARHLSDCSLVLDAVGIPNRIPPGQAVLTVPSARAVEAGYQLDKYFEENADWPELPPAMPMPRHAGGQPTILFIGSLAIFFLVTGPWDENTLWFANGAINSEAILNNNEWWRLVTALTLHADMLHLVGNCVIGGFLVHLLVSQLGSGIGWTLLILCGAAGNFLNIAARETVHHSVGFSTSIFGAIGLFSGMRMVAGKNLRAGSILIPLGAGAGLLAMLGAEGERTDLGAHFFGFLCGIMLGLASRFLGLHSLSENSSLQQTLLFLISGIIIFCWLLAMK
ncbi:MAG: rhomboid family intramembrane serine protease [Desulfobulbaceae bacterium]|nr:rhomboid family intramembrane serine protease [Desulfobulbaceae bacterium]